MTTQATPNGESSQARQSSCAECKRLKLRCDKKIPCATCVSRGCASVCPNGTLQKGRAKGQRMVLTDMRYLYDKINAMQKRMSDLQVAIDAAKSKSSNASPTNTPSSTADSHKPHATTPSSVEVDSQMSQAFGTLTLGAKPSWYGPNASSNYLLGTSKSRKWQLPAFVTLPEWDPKKWGDQSLACLGVFKASLPPRKEAFKLANAVATHTGWLFGGLTRDEILPLLDKIYPNDEPSLDDVTRHDIAVVFAFLAVAILVDPDQPPQRDLGFTYFNLATMALCTDSVLEHPTIQGIRAIHLQNWFLQTADDLESIVAAYSQAGIAAQLCKCLGMHLDDGHWPVDDKEKQIRRRLIWDVITCDVWLCESLGRPAHFSTNYFDARLPVDEDAFFNNDGEWQQSFPGWMRSFTSVCMLPALEEIFQAREPPHRSVMRLDHIIREHPVSKSLQVPDTGLADPNASMALTLQRAVIAVQRQKLLMYIHRTFFSRAMAESGDDPLRHRFCESVIAAFRAAMHITSTVRALGQCVSLSSRFGFMWASAFSASVILASLVIRCPRSPLSAAAWVEVDLTMRALEGVSAQLRTIRLVMPSFKKLHAKCVAIREACEGRPKTPVVVDLDDAELGFYIGETRLMRQDDGPFAAQEKYDEELDTAADTELAMDESEDAPGEQIAAEGEVLLPPITQDQARAVEADYLVNFGLDPGTAGTTSHENIPGSGGPFDAWAGFMYDLGIPMEFDETQTTSS